jgi:hypothetical protein
MPIISANSINRFVFIKETKNFFCDVGTGILFVIQTNVNTGKFIFHLVDFDFLPCTIVALADSAITLHETTKEADQTVSPEGACVSA